MAAGAVLSAGGAVLMAGAGTTWQFVASGALLSIGTATFVAANWSMTTSTIPRTEAARFMGIANIGTAGAAAVAGLFGPVIDVSRALVPGLGYAAVFVSAAVAFVVTLLVVRPLVESRRSTLGEAESTEGSERTPDTTVIALDRSHP